MAVHIENNMDDWMDKPETKQSIGVKADSSFYDLIRGEKRFPRPIKLGRSSRWIRREVEDWKAKQIAERDAA